MKRHTHFLIVAAKSFSIVDRLRHGLIHSVHNHDEFLKYLAALQVELFCSDLILASVCS